MNKRKHDWKHFSRRTLSLILVLVTLVALCIPTGMALEDNSADEPETVTVQAAEPETSADAEAAATSETDAQPVAETEPAAEVEQEQVTEPAAEQVSEPEAAASTPAETETTAVEPELTTEHAAAESDAQTASEPVEMIDLNGDTDAVVLAGDVAIQNIDNKSEITIAVEGTYSLNSSGDYYWSSSNESIATVNNGTVTGKGVGDATITKRYRNWYGGWSNETISVHVLSAMNAAIYYMANPANDYKTNDTSAWAPNSNKADEASKVTAIINVNNNSPWEDNGDLKAKNLTTNLANYIVSWPDRTSGTVWTLRKNDTATGAYFEQVLDLVWDAYKDSISKELKVNLNRTDVTSIKVTAGKISRNNGGAFPYHLDCTLDIKCEGVYTAKFMVLNPVTNEYEQVDGKNYKANQTVAKTGEATIGSKATFNNEEYVLTGWYDESGNLIDESKWTNGYTPNTDELDDGTVYFYAHYEPVNKNEKVYVYVAGYEIINGQKVRYSDEMLNLLDINPKTIDGNGYFPVGTVEVPKTFFSGKNSPYIQTDADWNTLKNVLTNMDVAALTDDGVTEKDTRGTDYNSAYNGVIYTANNNNKVKDYLEYAHGDTGYSSGSMMTALFDWNSSRQWNYGYLNAGQNAKYHLDLRFSTNHITFMYGDNNINDGTKFADGNNAWKDGEEVGSQVYITKSITAARSAYDHFDVPEGYTWDGKFYKNAKFTEEYNDNEIFSISIEQNYDVYLRLTKNPGTLVINKTINPSKWMTTEELESLKDNLTFTATQTNGDGEFTFKLSEMVDNGNGTYTYTKTDLPGDSTWTVSESGEKLDYVTCATTITYENDADHATVPKGGTATVNVTNTYTDDLVNLTISKTVKGNNKNPGSFTFVATNERTGISYTVTIEGTGTETIYDIPAGKYTVIELENDNFECTKADNDPKDITTADEVVDFAFENKGTGDSYQYSSSVVNKSTGKDGSFKVKFAQFKESTTNH